MTGALLTVRDLQAKLGVSRGTAYELVASGTIPSIRLGRSVRIRNDAVEQWLLEIESKEPYEPSWMRR